mgnify:CR=1 FL=1
MLSSTMINNEKFFIEAFKNQKINEERVALLKQIAAKISTEYIHKKKVNLNFICTHNSRRSQFGQVWSFFAAHYFKLPFIHAFSGGTEVTAFHQNTVKALQKTGFIFSLKEISHQNPIYNISFEGCKQSLIGFSKIYDDVHNDESFIALTTCDNADNHCPIIHKSIGRFHLPFKDPKTSDNTEKQAPTYLNTSAEIAATIYFIFSEVKKRIH